MDSLARLSASALSRPATAAAIEFERQWLSWGDMRQLADRVGELVDASGAEPGARIALVARNHPAAIAAFLGLLAKAHSVRMVYPFQSAAGIARELDSILPAAVIAAEEDMSDEVRRVLAEKGMAGFALRGMDVAALPELARSRIKTDTPPQPQIEILTSGTTGKPKPFALSHDVVARHLISPSATPAQDEGDPSQLPPVLLYFPIGNISGLYSTLPALLNGRRAMLLERFSVAGWHDHLLRYRPTIGGLPPAGIQMVMDANLPREDLSCLRMIGAGAAPLAPAVQRAFEARYGVPILLSYGATEFGGPVTRTTPEMHATWGEQKMGSVGKALPEVQLRVVDPVSGQVLPPGETGILEVIAPRIGPDWIRTADIAVIDEDDFLFLQGRADGAIIRGGFKLLPETIEQALMLHPAVSAAAVVGIADERLGQVPAAAVVLKPGAGHSIIDELELHLRQQVLATHLPAAWKIVDQLPRTRLSFKVDQAAVRQLFEEEYVTANSNKTTQ